MPEAKKRPTQKRWIAKKRQPATFNVVGMSAAFPGQTMEWTIVVGDDGYVCTRKTDGRRVFIAWREAIGLAMFDGRDSARQKEKKL